MDEGRSDNSLFIQIITVIVSIITGVVAGILFPTHFLFARYVAWIGLAIAVIIFVLMLIATAGEKRRAFRRCACRYVVSEAVAVFGLMLTSIIKISIADARTTIHALVFAFIIFFLGWALLTAIEFALCVHRAHCNECNECDC